MNIAAQDKAGTTFWLADYEPRPRRAPLPAAWSPSRNDAMSFMDWDEAQGVVDMLPSAEHVIWPSDQEDPNDDLVKFERFQKVVPNAEPVW